MGDGLSLFVKWKILALATLVSSSVKAMPWNNQPLQDAVQMDVGPHPEIKKAHLVFMTHFDVGYTVPTVREILDLYTTTFFPSAFNTSRVLRERGGPEQFQWTSHAWLLDTLLRNESDSTAEFRSDTMAAIDRADITWHANPMNMQGEVGSAHHINFGQSLAHTRFDDRFRKQRKRAASQKDVPGMSLGIVPIMAQNGVEFIHIGVNDMSTPPAFPNKSPPSQGLCNVGYWQYIEDSGRKNSSPKKILISYCSGYNAPVTSTIIPGFDEALVFLMKIDNRGPHTAEDVIEVWNTTQHIYPNAELVMSSMDAWYDALEKRLEESPTIQIPTIENMEFGDTWVYGTSSDPTKMRWYRAVMREIDVVMERNKELEKMSQDETELSFLTGTSSVSDSSVLGRTQLRRKALQDVIPFCNTTSPDFIHFYTTLLKIPEHTWGHNGNPCNMNFTNAEWLDPSFGCQQYGESYHTVRSSWIDQRNFVPLAIEQLDDSLHGDLKKHLKKVVADREPRPEHELQQGLGKKDSSRFQGYVPFNPWRDTILNYVSDDGTNTVKLRVNAGGAIDHLVIGNVTICTPSSTSPDAKDHALGVLTYRTHSEEDLNEFGNAYCEGDCSSSCGRCGFGKCNMDCRYTDGKERCGLSRSSATPATVNHGWSRRLNSTIEEFWFVSTFENMDALLRDEYGPPEYTVTKFVVDATNLSSEKGELVLHYDLTWYRKPETRMAESIWFSFAPLVDELPENDGWRMHKLGKWIDPMNVAVNGSRAIHNIWDGIKLVDKDETTPLIQILSPDAPVVSPNLDFSPTGLYTSTARPNDGWAFSLFNNAWNTNYPLWSLEKEERFQFRVGIKVA
jgi:hypothetical protein